MPGSIFPRRQNERDNINEKYSYLAVKKGLIPSQIYKEEFEAPTPAEKSFFWPRILRPVLKR